MHRGHAKDKPKYENVRTTIAVPMETLPNRGIRFGIRLRSPSHTKEKTDVDDETVSGVKIVFCSNHEITYEGKCGNILVYAHASTTLLN
jgi:hypothetical protein